MGRSRAYVQFSIWEGLKGASPLGKLLYHRLLSEDTLTQCGVAALRVDLWADDLELAPDEVNLLLDELEAKRYAYTDRTTHQVLVRTLVRNDGIADIPNILWTACRAAKLLRSPKLRRVLAAELRKLPPKPPDKFIPGKGGKADRWYVYPDPHATADAIDPGPEEPDGPDPGEREAPAVNGRAALHPGIPSTSHVDPIAMGSTTQAHPIASEAPEGTPADPMRIPSPWVRGGGGGGGGGETHLEENSSLESACSQARRAARVDAPAREGPREGPREPDPPGAGRTQRRPRHGGRGEGFIGPGGEVLDIPAYRHGAWSVVGPWKAGHSPPYRAATYRELGKHVDALLARGAPPELVTAALEAWDARPGHAAPGLLPHLYDDAVRATRAQVALPAAPRSRTSDAADATEAAALAFLARHGGKLPTLRRTGRS